MANIFQRIAMRRESLEKPGKQTEIGLISRNQSAVAAIHSSSFSKIAIADRDRHAVE
jgi:hypothetical protein